MYPGCRVCRPRRDDDGGGPDELRNQRDIAGHGSYGRAPRLLKVPMRVVFPFIFLLVLFLPSQVHAQQFRLHEEVRIGDDEKAGTDYLLAGPRRATFDAAGNLYVIDGSSPTVRIFDPGGRFVRRLGAPGQGPGEMQAVDAIAAESDGSILVADSRNQRLTRFHQSGAVDVYPFPEQGFITVRDILPLPDGRIGLAYRRPAAGARSDPAEHLIHLFDREFKMRQGSIIPASLFLNVDEPFISALWSATGASHFGTDGRNIVGVPQFYEGQIFRVDPRSARRPEPIQGYRPRGRPYQLIQVGRAQQNPANTLVISGAEGQFAALQNTRSAGLWATDTGIIVHTFSLRERDSRSLFIQVLDASGQNLGRREIPDYFVEGRLNRYVLSVSPKGRIAMVDLSTGFPVIHIMQLDISEQTPGRR
jgi:hypothetical protein